MMTNVNAGLEPNKYQCLDLDVIKCTSFPMHSMLCNEALSPEL